MRISTVIGLYFRSDRNHTHTRHPPLRSRLLNARCPLRLISLNTPAERETEFHFSADTLCHRRRTDSMQAGSRTKDFARPAPHPAWLAALPAGRDSVTYRQPQPNEKRACRAVPCADRRWHEAAAGAVCGLPALFHRPLLFRSDARMKRTCAEVAALPPKPQNAFRLTNRSHPPCRPGDAGQQLIMVPTGTSGQPANF